MPDRIEQQIVINAPLDRVWDLVSVTVVESGFDALDVPEEVRQSQLKDNTGGWSEELGSLRARAQEPASA